MSNLGTEASIQDGVKNIRFPLCEASYGSHYALAGGAVLEIV
jgi:hypothetical protein